MKIYYHEMQLSLLELSDDDVSELMALLEIPETEYSRAVTRNGTRMVSGKLAKKEAVHIAIPSKAAYSTIKLHGGFFDWYPNFPIPKFRDFLNKRGGRLKTADYSYRETDKKLDFDQLKITCANGNWERSVIGTWRRKREIKGEEPDSNNRDGIPDTHGNFDLIHLGDRDSVSPVKIYRSLLTGVSKFEVTINDHGHNDALLALYNPETIGVWEEAAKAVLVKAIDFIEPDSFDSTPKIRQAWFSEFLGSEVTPIKWGDVEPPKIKHKIPYAESISREIARIQNITRRHGYAALGDDLILKFKRELLKLPKEIAKLEGLFYRVKLTFIIFICYLHKYLRKY